MPLRLDIKRKFLQRSERVKCVDIHPTEPWLLANLYNGASCIAAPLLRAMCLRGCAPPGESGGRMGLQRGGAACRLRRGLWLLLRAGAPSRRPRVRRGR